MSTAGSDDEAEGPSFRELLRSHRTLAGLTQQALADLSKISPRTIRDLEAGRANARRQTIHLLAHALELKGLAREVFVHAGLRSQPAGPSRGVSADVAVPRHVNALLGRDTEVRALAETLWSGHSRMISISGLPGAGKTRVAAEIARRLAARHGWPVLWIGEDTESGTRLGMALGPLLRSLRSVIEREARDLSRVCQFMRDHEALLVLDGIADVHEPGGVEELLTYCPGVRVISTSRIPWHVAGLPSTVISPLATPEEERDEDLSAQALARVPSARLLLDRLSEVRPGFELGVADVRAVAEICRRLDGLPLALETVVGQLRVLSLQQLAEIPVTDLLEFALPIRSGSEPRTIAGLLRWSFERQDARLRAMLRKLASFDDALTATDVARLLSLKLDEVVDDLSVLIGCGLIRASHGEPATLLRIPNLLRAFLLRLPQPAGPPHSMTDERRATENGSRTHIRAWDVCRAGPAPCAVTACGARGGWAFLPFGLGGSVLCGEAQGAAACDEHTVPGAGSIG